MDKKTTGSWLIHHTNKLQNVTNQQNYEQTFLAGKAGILLSAIASDNQAIVDTKRLHVLAKSANINTIFELPKLIGVLKSRSLIEEYCDGIAVLGLTTASTLIHTTDIFENLEPSSREFAAIDLAEHASHQPITAKEAQTILGDIFELDKRTTSELITESSQLGFVDEEKLSSNETLLFNGNLFRRDTTRKLKVILDSLSATEQSNLKELSELLKLHACVDADSAKKIIGEKTFSKVISIGLFDVNIVSNSSEEVAFLTLPSAFSKYSNAMIDDAFDLAKAFLSSIKYGMTKSSYARGNIRMVEALLSALVGGESVGPVRAIEEDYKILELKGVVQVYYGTKKGRYGPMLKLLKKEVGELALQVLDHGDISEHSLTHLPTSAVTSFKGPEYSREISRRKQVASSPKSTNDMISILRTGGGF